MDRADRPAHYRDALRVRAFRGLLLAHILSALGDQVARVALASLVFERSDSAALTAVAYAATYLPWALGATLLSDVADRFPRRDVLVVCDVTRAALLAVMAIPGAPLWVVLPLALGVTLLEPPFASARAALLPDVLDGDAYVVGSALVSTSTQLSFVFGFALGGLATSLVTPSGALALDAGTFALSALFVLRTVPRTAGRQQDLGVDRRGGPRYVFGTPPLRSLVVLTWATAAATVVPEGLAVPFAQRLGAGPAGSGLLLAALPAGAVVGSVLLARLVAPSRRLRLVRPLAVLSCVVLLPSALVESLPLLWALWFVSGLGLSFNLPANAAFVAFSRPELRGRAFAVAQGGLMLAQGLAILLAGGLVLRLEVPYVVTLCAVLGVVAAAFLPLHGLRELARPPRQVRSDVTEERTPEGALSE